jgi:DNA gyrase subunit A
MEFINHRQLVVVRRSQFELAEARDRAHILEGLLIALKNLDDVIETIRRSADTETAKASLMSKFGLSDAQAQAILDMQLKRLAALERQKIEDEYKAIQETIKGLFKLLNNPDELLALITKETEEMMTLYGDDRRTKVVKGKVGEFSEEDLIANEETVITLTETGYIKRMDPSSFRSQARGGKGSIGMTTKEEDVVKKLLVANTHDSLLLFTNLGRVFKMKVYDMAISSRQAKGTAIVNLISLKPGEQVQSVLIFNETQDKDAFICLATRQGLVKKTAVKLFDNIRATGIIAITLNDTDQLVAGALTSGKGQMLLITHQGKCIRFNEEEVKNSNRDTKGVRGITLRKDDYVVGMETFEANIDQEGDDTKKQFRNLLLITENGMGKRTTLNEYPVQKRSGQGVKVAEITAKTGNVAAAMIVSQDHDEVVITTSDGQTIKLPISKKSIPVLTRPTQGVILMRLKDDNKVAAAALTWKDEAVDKTTAPSPVGES